MDESTSTSRKRKLDESSKGKQTLTAEMPAPSKVKVAGNLEEAAAKSTDDTKHPTENRNAFQELMSRKAPKAAVPAASTQQSTVPSGLRLQNPVLKSGRSDRRNDLKAYTTDPSNIPQDLRLYDNEDFVAIKDMFPKSTVHTLLLFKSPRNELHPFHFFEDPEMLAKTREEVKKLRRMVAQQLERQHGKFSASDKKRQQVLHGEITLADGEDLPKGRDWESEVMVGVHARPSMNHVHVHVISKDRFSPFLKHRNHYQSFSSPFFVDFDDLPLPPDDPRWNTDMTNSYIKSDFLCWRCGRKGFKNFPDLKQHLAEEFEKWKAE